MAVAASAQAQRPQAPPPAAPAPTQPSATEAVLSGLYSRWVATFDGSPAAMPAFDERSAFVALRGGPLVAIDLDRGTQRWRVDLIVDFTPAVGKGRVFVAADSAIVALDAASGKTIWRTPLADALGAPLYWDTGWLIASTKGGELAAFRAEDGEIVWRKTLGVPVGANPVAALDGLYLGLADGRVICLDLATGNPRWEYKLDGRITGMAALDDQLIAGTTTNQLVSIGLARGNYLQRWRVGADPVGAPTGDSRHIYFVALDNVLRAVDRRNGNLRWMRTLTSRPSGAPLLVDNVVLIPFVSAALSAFGAIDGKPLFDLAAAGELAGPPHLRTGGPLTGARLVTISREGHLQGFAQSIEAAPAPIVALPGVKVGG
jgi:outer membrane protein assembly factor BamB